MKKIEVIEEWKINIKDWCLRIDLDWDCINNKSDLFNEFKKKITFPSYFWENWDALWDVITDRDFINNDVVVIISNFDNLFTYRDEKSIFMAILIDWLNCKHCNYDVCIYIVV